MIGLVVTLKVKPGSEADFEATMGELIGQVRANEPGCKLYTLAKDPKEAGTYVMMEIYADKESLDAHGKTPYFAAAGPKLGAVLAGAPTMQRLQVVV
ncbi:MAG: antibiotic biosynthesis monooxygenase [Alphaproteobacteria bacterium]|nr:antibiotic biosynthesis monooxygenase [Alphaproteobacteria bacterium]